MTTARRGQRANLQRHQKKHRKRKAHNAERQAARAKEKRVSNPLLGLDNRGRV